MKRRVRIDGSVRTEVLVADDGAVEVVPKPIPPPSLEPLADLIRELASRNAQLEREAGALAEKLAVAEAKLLEAPDKGFWHWLSGLTTRLRIKPLPSSDGDHETAG